VTGGKPIAVRSQSISGVNAINPLVAFYDIHGRKREVLIFYFVSVTTRDLRTSGYNTNCTQKNIDLCNIFKVIGKDMVPNIIQRIQVIQRAQTFLPQPVYYLP
jgi:hypothetical protein